MPHLSASKWLTIACSVLALIAALVAIYAARLPLGDLDVQAENEKRIGRWNTFAGSLNAVSTALLLLAIAIETFGEK